MPRNIYFSIILLYSLIKNNLKIRMSQYLWNRVYVQILTCTNIPQNISVWPTTIQSTSTHNCAFSFQFDFHRILPNSRILLLSMDNDVISLQNPSRDGSCKWSTRDELVEWPFALCTLRLQICVSSESEGQGDARRCRGLGLIDLRRPSTKGRQIGLSWQKRRAGNWVSSDTRVCRIVPSRCHRDKTNLWSIM